MLSRTRLIAAAMLALSVGTPSSLGQAALPTQFTLRQLERQPGTILISPGYITIIEFPEAVSEALSGNQTLFKTSPRKGSNLVVLTAAKATGQTDLLVRAGGKIAMFLVKIDAQGNAPRRYTVTGQSAPTLPDAARPAAPPVAAIAAVPTPRPTSSPAATTLSNRYEAEAAILYRANSLNQPQASGGRLVEHINDAQSRVTFPAIRALKAGSYTLRIAYTNGTPGLATQSLMVNGVAAPEVRYPPTSNWWTVANVDVTVNLRAGLNILRFGLGQGVATLDALELLGAAGSVPASATLPTTTSSTAAPLPTAQATTRSTQRQMIPVTNGGFESDLANWSSWQDKTNDIPQAIGTQRAHGGGKYLVLSSKVAQRQNTLQTITGLSTGTYTLEMWIRTSGGQNGLTLFALDYGGKELNLGVPTSENATWAKYTLPGIAVTTGQVKIGIWSNSPAGNIWAHIDDMALYREADQP